MIQITLHDLLAQETKRDPSALFARLRANDPLCSVTDFGGFGHAWIATNYEDVTAILKDPRFIRDKRKISLPENGQEQKSPEPGSQAEMFAWRRDILMVDPPDHTRLRHLIASAFTPRMIEQLRPRIQQITDELLDAVQPQGTMDLIADFAYPLPFMVICDMLGIPPTDRQPVHTRSPLLANIAEASEAGVTALQTSIHSIKALLTEKRAHPGNDLTSQLVQVEENGDQLSEQELISTIFLLFGAGHETTVNLIGNGMLALFEHPRQLHLLRADPSLIPEAIEELLRYTPPSIVAAPRWANEDITLRDKVIRKGEQVFVSLIGANTDPQRYADPEVLDLTRQVNQHLAFGKGIHHCLGAPLARLEGHIAFSTLLQRLPDIHLACDPAHLVWSGSFSLRGLASLPVAF